MKNLSTKWSNVKNYLYKHYGQESGKMIVHAGVATWILAAVSQVGAVVFNDKISKDQKKFLVPQEIADGIINIVTFYAITNSLKSLAGRLVSTGKWSNASIRNFIAKNPSKEIQMGELSTNLGKTYKDNEDFYKAYSPFKNGVDMIATTVGSVVASNIVTPYIRNYYGAKQQKRSISQDKLKNSYSPYPKNSMKI